MHEVNLSNFQAYIKYTSDIHVHSPSIYEGTFSTDKLCIFISVQSETFRYMHVPVPRPEFETRGVNLFIVIY